MKFPHTPVCEALQRAALKPFDARDTPKSMVLGSEAQNAMTRLGLEQGESLFLPSFVERPQV